MPLAHQRVVPPREVVERRHDAGRARARRTLRAGCSRAGCRPCRAARTAELGADPIERIVGDRLDHEAGEQVVRRGVARRSSTTGRCPRAPGSPHRSGVKTMSVAELGVLAVVARCRSQWLSSRRNVSCLVVDIADRCRRSAGSGPSSVSHALVDQLQRRRPTPSSWSGSAPRTAASGSSASVVAELDEVRCLVGDAPISTTAAASTPTPLNHASPSHRACSARIEPPSVIVVGVGVGDRGARSRRLAHERAAAATVSAARRTR